MGPYWADYYFLLLFRINRNRKNPPNKHAGTVTKTLAMVCGWSVNWIDGTPAIAIG